MTSRAAGALLTLAGLAIGLLSGGSVALGADSPDGAVRELVERIESGAFEDLSGVSCAEFEERVRAEFDPAAIDPAFGEAAVEVVDPTITLVSQEQATAIVSLVATLRVTFDEERLREVVRAQLEAGGQEATDEDIELMLGALAVSEVPVDEDLTVVERDGEWLICEPGGGFTDAGMCGLVTPDEIAALAPVPIQSNVGSGEFCQWIGATETDYLSVDVGLIRDASLDDYRSDDPFASELTIGDRAALISSGQLFVEVEGGVLSVVPDLQDAPSAQALDPIAFASSVAELFLPRLDRLPAPDEGS